MVKKNSIRMYSIHKEGKSAVAERFIRTLKNKIFKHMTSISKNVYIDKFIIHILTLLKKLMIEIFSFKLVIMLEYQNTKTLLLKDIFQIGPKKFLYKKFRTTFPWTYFINDLNVAEIIGCFYEKELQKTIQK